MIVKDILAAARIKAVDRHPYMATALFALRFIEKPGIKTMSVDFGGRLFYDPEVVTEWGINGCMSVIFHEVQHVIRNHSQRAGDRDQRTWNLANDAEINDDLIAAGHKLPGVPVTPGTFQLKDGETAEWYYEKITEKQQQEQEQRQKEQQARASKEEEEESDEQDETDNGDAGDEGNSAGPSRQKTDKGKPDDNGDGDDGDTEATDENENGDQRMEDDRDDDGDDSGDDDDQPKEENDDSGGGDPKGSDDSDEDSQQGGDGNNGDAGDDDSDDTGGAPGHGGCGGCAGNPKAWEDDDLDKNPRHDSLELEVIRKQTAQEIIEHSMRGTVPPDLLQWAKASLTPPEIDWRKALSAKIRHAVASKSGATDYTRRKVSRRQWAMRAAFGKNAPVLPSLHSPVPEITVVVDKSGSMTGRLEAALSEVVGILKAVNAPVKVMAADMNAHKSIKVSGGRDLKTFAQADGGTDMRVGIREASEDKACNVIILLTDGETPWPTLAEMPRQSVIVGLVTTEEGAKWLRVPDHIKKRSVMIKLDKNKY